MGKLLNSEQALQNLLDIIRFTENLSTKLHGLATRDEIFKIIEEEFTKSKQYSESILLKADNESKLNVVSVNIPGRLINIAQKATGLRLKEYSVDLNKSNLYRQVYQNGDTIHAQIKNILEELFPKALYVMLSKILDFKGKSSILAPLRIKGKIVGAFSMTAPELSEEFIPSVNNLVAHISRALELAETHSMQLKAEDNYRELIKNIPAGIAVSTPKGEVIEVNNTLLQIFGYNSKEEFLKVAASDHYYDKADREKLIAVRKKGQVQFEARLKRKDGSLFWGLVTSKNHKASTGELQFLNVVQDISNLKRFEEKILFQQEELATRARVIKTTLSSFDLDNNLNSILNEIMSLLNIEYGGIYLYSEQRFVLRAWKGVSDEFRAQIISFPENKIPDWMKDYQIIQEPLSKSGKAPDYFKREGIQTWTTAPLKFVERDKEHLVGILILGSRRLKAFSRQTIDILKPLREHLALAIERVLRFREAELRLVRLKVLREIDRAIINKFTLKDILDTVISNIPREMGADAVAISLIKETQQTSLFSMHLPNGTIIDEEAFTIADSLLEHFIRRKEAVIISDLSQDRRLQMHHKRILGNQLVSYLGMPLIVKNHTVGILHLLTTRKKIFAAEDIDFFHTLAGQAAIAIENAKMLEELKKSEENFRLLVEGVKEYAILMLDPEGHIISWNSGVELMKGYKAEEIIGKHFSCFYTKEDIKAGKPEHELKNALKDGFFKGEGWRVRKDGSKFWANVIITAMRDRNGNLHGFSKITRDMTEQKQAWEKLRKSEANYRLLFDSSGTCNWVASSDGKILMINKNAASLVGGKPKDFKGKSVYDLDSKEDADNYIEMFREVIKSGKTKVFEYYAQLPTGDYWFSAVISPVLEQNGTCNKVLIASRDITEQKLKEIEMREMHRNLVESNKKLLKAYREETNLREKLIDSEKLAALGQMGAKIAHEINNPLTIIMGNAQLQMMKKLDENLQKTFDLIVREAKRIKNIASTFMNLSKPVITEKMRLNINDVIEESIKDLLTTGEIKYLQVQRNLQKGLPAVLGDSERLMQVFRNLIVNASHAMLNCDEKKLKISTAMSKDNKYVQVSIQDSGHGIAKDKLDEIFNLYYTTKPEGMGTGLGLAVVKDIVEKQHSGKVTVKSKIGKGTTFTIQLPFELKKDQRKILVIDDENYTRSVLADFFREKGFIVYEAINGVEGFEKFKEIKPDIVLTDVQMPVMDGFELAEKIRSHSPAQKIIFISGFYYLSEIKSKLVNYNFPCVSKPCDLPELWETVNSELKK